MDILEQCQIWNENDQPQRIIDTLEAIPAEERTPEMDSELARAYNNAAGPEDRALYQRAIALLAPHAGHFQGDYCWNFRMGYAWYYLDQEGRALRYFEKALEARPGDEDTQELIDDCRSRLALPRFGKNFRERTAEAWAAFADIEAELRTAMDADKKRTQGEALLEKCRKALEIALREPSFELGFNGERYELILSPEGRRSQLFPLVYFRRRAPKEVLEHWNIRVGRQPSGGLSLRAGETQVRAEDVRVWAEKTENTQVNLVLCCEKLLPLLKDEPDKAWWMLSTLVDQVLGEISAMAVIGGFDVCAAPKDGPSIPLTDLPRALRDMGLTLRQDAGAYLEDSFLAYEQEPVQDPEADWRLDVFTGTCRLPALINDYMAARSDTADDYHQQGIAAGFLCYPLDRFTGEARDEHILDFRNALQEAIRNEAGDDAVTFLGGAAGLYRGYLDFIAWDLFPVLNAAKAFFEESDLPWAQFHTFRRDVGGVPLLDREADAHPPVHPETGSLLSPEDIAALERFTGGVSGYYGKMLDYIQDFVEQGVRGGRFTLRQARRDPQIALWYAYACNNLDQYEFYYRAAQWMPESEQNAKGCGTWYYRYSAALMYCGRLEEARRYAEQGTREEPDYPWIWLQAGRLRSHFGDRAGALEAARRGLALVPGDYEFLTLEREIRAGATLEQMEYHWIDPASDRKLQEGLGEGIGDKQRSIACITTDQAGLEDFFRLFAPDPADYTRNAPYCSFHRRVQGHTVEVVFRMNEAGLSKLGRDWLQTQRERLDDGRWLAMTAPDGQEGFLEAVLLDLDRSVTLVYRVRGKENRHFQALLGEDGAPFHLSMEGRENDTAYYSAEEMEAVERHIAHCFGSFESVWHELVSPDVHVDICLIPPAGERDYCTLVTMGMGARRMNVPEELAAYKLERAELAVALPPDWKLDQESLSDERWYWPIRLLKVLARLPIEADTWLGWGHTMDNQTAFAESTDLCGAMLVSPQGAEEGAEACSLPDGDEVNFYQVIPLYRDEMDFKQRHGAEALLERMEDVSFVVDPHRPSALDTEEAAQAPVLDDGALRLKTAREKELAADPLAVYNHMAIFLRWCMEHDLMSLEFLERYGDLPPGSRRICPAWTCGPSSGTNWTASCSRSCSTRRVRPLPSGTTMRGTSPATWPTWTPTPWSISARSGITPASFRTRPICSSPSARTTIVPWPGSSRPAGTSGKAESAGMTRPPPRRKTVGAGNLLCWRLPALFSFHLFASGWPSGRPPLQFPGRRSIVYRHCAGSKRSIQIFSDFPRVFCRFPQTFCPASAFSGKSPETRLPYRQFPHNA